MSVTFMTPASVPSSSSAELAESSSDSLVALDVPFNAALNLFCRLAASSSADSSAFGAAAVGFSSSDWGSTAAGDSAEGSFEAVSGVRRATGAT